VSARLQARSLAINIEHCPSFSGICWIDPTTKIYYPVDTTQQRSWANDCEAGRALVTQPNVRLIDLWRTGNGQMNRDSKRPNPKEKRSALDRMLDMSESIGDEDDKGSTQ
jgi:hypothetical protein